MAELFEAFLLLHLNLTSYEIISVVPIQGLVVILTLYGTEHYTERLR